MEKCLNSLKNQTYQNLEIIVIDDGATDESGKICDHFAKIDSRFHVFHQKNAGLSAARNAGLKKATGYYLTFIDSDDYADDYLISTLVENLESTKSDLSVVTFCEEFIDSPIINQNSKTAKKLIMNKSEALTDLLLETHFRSHAFCKLFPRALFKGLEFPVGKTLEDVATTYKLFDRIDQAVFAPIPCYHYIQRSNSIMGNVTEKLITDYSFALFDRLAYLKPLHPELETILKVAEMNAIKTLYYYCYSINITDDATIKNLIQYKKYKKDYQTYRRLYKEYHSQIPATDRRSSALFYHCKPLYRLHVRRKVS